MLKEKKNQMQMKPKIVIPITVALVNNDASPTPPEVPGYIE